MATLTALPDLSDAALAKMDPAAAEAVIRRVPPESPAAPVPVASFGSSI